MKRWLLLSLGILLFSEAPAWAQRQLVDRVVAVVNDEAITQSELDLYLRPLYEELKKQGEGPELMNQLRDARLKLLNQLIEDRLVYQESKTLGINVDEVEIDDRMNELKERFPSEKDFDKTLSQDGLSLTELRERYRREIAIRKLHDAEIRSKVVISPRKIEDYYENRRSEFAEEEKVRVRSITVRKSEETIEKGLADEPAKKKIEEAEKRIQAGESFEKLAGEFSEDAHAKEGGLVGWVKRGEMMLAIEKSIFGIKMGGISPVLETSAGYHLFKVEEKTASRVPPFEEVRDKIREILFKEEAQKRFKEWMEGLKGRAYISVR